MTLRPLRHAIVPCEKRHIFDRPAQSSSMTLGSTLGRALIIACRLSER